MTLVLPQNIQKTRKRQRKLRPIKPPRGVRKGYRDSLDSINSDLNKALEPVNRLLNDDASPSNVADVIQMQSDRTQTIINAAAPAIASAFVLASSRANKSRMESTFNSALGIDVAKIVDEKNIEHAIDAAMVENVSLIRSIPQQYWVDVIQAVMANFRDAGQVGGVSFTERLKKIGNISDNRARLIARDQTSKLNASLTRIRHQNIGINKYRWRNSQDTRVVGNPVGLYPTGSRVHGDHWKREGKLYSYDNSPPDGSPGMAILCRCWAEAVLDLDDINVIYL